MFTYYDKSPREKIVTIWDDDKRRIAEVSNAKKNGRWIWECSACRIHVETPWKGCAHIVGAWRFMKQRKIEQKKIWERMDKLYPAEPTTRTRVRFAPCPD